ncbi:MAG: Gfo/Idh/MocA family oxidoreductase [Chloroflexi bacterium]|nr:Gfo/Idh/MocA family oxidoreductase [Chloroflexota bacterium]
MSTRIGVIGTGFMGRTWAEVAANHVDDTQVVAVAGGRRAEALARDYGAALESSPASLLARNDIDLVVVATQPDSHRDYVVQVAEAGKHALVEKPMSQTVGEADAMVAAHEKAGTVLAVCSQHRFRAAPVAAIQLIRDGAIGDLRMIRAQGVITQDEAAEPDNEPYADMGFHVLDVVRGIVGSPATIAFGQQASFRVPPARGSTMALYRFANDVLASIWITYELPQPGLGSMGNYLITGSKGMIDLDSYGAVKLGDARGWRTVFEQAPFDPNDPNDPIRLKAYADELRDILRAIRDRGQALVSGSWGRDTMELIDAARIASDRGQSVRLPLEPSLRTM